MQFHGDIRFHLELHEMTKEPFFGLEPVPPHWHEEYEFFSDLQEVLEQLALITKNNSILSPGDILFINCQGMLHSFRVMKKSTGFLLSS